MSIENEVTNGITTNKNELCATLAMCVHCFDEIIQELQRSASPHKPSLFDGIPDHIQCPLFITWDKKHRSKFSLRGCIGTLSPRPLKKSLGEYAKTSAFHDHRFGPIKASELFLLRVGVSLLVNYESCENCFDWEVGKHGIIIKFYYSGGHYQGTFLPEVCVQQSWTQQETVAHLVRKAGYEGVTSSDLLSSIKCSRYQSSKYQLTYDEYVKVVGRNPLNEEVNKEELNKKNLWPFSGSS